MDGKWIAPVQLIDSAVVESALKAPGKRNGAATRRVDLRMSASFEERPDPADDRLLVCLCSLEVGFSFSAGDGEGAVCDGSCRIAGAASVLAAAAWGSLGEEERRSLVRELRRETLSLVYGEARGHVEQVTATSTAGRRILPAIDAGGYLSQQNPG